MPWLRKAVDTPFGAIPYGPVRRVNSYYKDASAAAIYPGDFVILETDGGLAVAAASSTNIIGVAAMYSPASTAENNFLVYDHPEQEFVCQDDGDTTHMARTEEGLRFDLTVTTGDTTTLRSKHEIDSNTATANSTSPILVRRLHPIEEDGYATAAGSQRRWICKIAQHFLQPVAPADVTYT